MNEYDVVIIGGGAAGLSAALVLTRARCRVAVVDAGHPRNAPAAHMHGFLGSDGRPPTDLLRAGRKEVVGYGGHLISGIVVGLTGNAPQFDIELADGRSLRARRVLVTTGLRDEIPDIPGARERWGRDLLHCPYCHGYEVRDQPLGVIGGSPEAIAHAHLIRQWSADVVFFTNGSTIGLIVTDDQLAGVELESDQIVSRAAMFVRPRFIANDNLLTALGAANNNGWITVDPTGLTSVPGVWAAGNAVNPRAQVITAAGEGSAAAIAINNDLVGEDLHQAVAQLRTETGESS
jgi:thioredoxin reductase